MKLKTFKRYAIKEIKVHLKTFFTLIVISLLGIGFWVGIKMLETDINNTVTAYLLEQNMYDIKIVSNLGLELEDIEAISKINGISEVYGAKTVDAYVTNFNNVTQTFRINSITNNINKVDLISGRMPNNTNECIVEAAYIKQQNINLGDYINIETSNDNIKLKQKSLQIVGIANSPLYISRERGFSNIGNGKLKYFMYIPEENFACDFFTELYIKIQNKNNIGCLTEDYDKILNSAIENIKTIEEERTRGKAKTSFKKIYRR